MVRKAGKPVSQGPSNIPFPVIYYKKKMNSLRFMLESPWPCTSFVLCSFALHKLPNPNALIGQLYDVTHYLRCCILLGFVQGKPPK